MATVPDYNALAQQQAGANNAAVDQTNMANRPNQYNPLGSITWGKNPDGSWGQSTNMSAESTNAYWAAVNGQQGLSGQIAQGLNTSALPGWGSTDMAGGAGPYGNTNLTSGIGGWGNTDLNGNLGAMPQVGQYNEQVINAWNALQEPGLAKSEAAQRNRLAAQGLTQGSRVSNASERNLGNVRTDAGNKAILAGYTQGNTEFGQALDARKQGYTENLGEANLMDSQRKQGYAENLGMSELTTGQQKQKFDQAQTSATMANQIRQQSLAEQTARYNSLLAGNTSLQANKDSLNPNSWATKVPASGSYTPVNYYGAAGDTFAGQRSQESIANSQSNAQNQMYGQLAGQVLGSQGFWNAAGAAGSWLVNDNNGNGSVWY